MKTIAILYGGESCEHDVSVITALTTFRVAKQKFQTILVYRKENEFWIGDALNDLSFYREFNEKSLKQCRFQSGYLIYKRGLLERKRIVDCVLNCCHGGAGEDGSMAGYFETVDTPYTSCEPFGSSLFMDKAFTKIFLEKNRFSFVPYRVLGGDEDVDKAEELGYPMIVKPARQGSSVGIGVARNIEELRSVIQDARVYDEKVVVEKCLEGVREFNCAVCTIGEEIVSSEVEEPVFKKDFLDFYDKYTDRSEAKRVLPAAVDEKLREKIRTVAKEIYRRAELKGVVRVDFLFDGKKLYVNEVNTVPGSLALYLFLPLGYKGSEILTCIVESAIERHQKKKKLVTDFSSDVLKQYVPTGKTGAKGILPEGIKKC